VRAGAAQHHQAVLVWPGPAHGTSIPTNADVLYSRLSSFCLPGLLKLSAWSFQCFSVFKGVQESFCQVEDFLRSLVP
jgi:hypothetical protein